MVSYVHDAKSLLTLTGRTPVRLIPSDPDLGTVVSRIRDHSLDLQPDFQRGSVWSRTKQRLLIDSILRDWYVPPIHVVRTDADEQVVLDGQQRLRAIYEFVQGHFAADGATEPFAEAIAEIGGLRYEELPDRNRRRFDRFTLRVFELVDYEPDEPYELFYRLNQPTTLTSAEKRNAFFGDARAEVKDLTRLAEEAGMSSVRIGFSNARFAYEDVIARFVWTLEQGRLSEKVTASRITARYRQPDGFDETLRELAAEALRTLFGLGSLDRDDVRLNKATAYSWLLFVARAIYRDVPLDDLNEFFAWVEITRANRKQPHSPPSRVVGADVELLLFPVLNDRAAARVNDVSSVLLRDAILWALLAFTHPGGDSPERRLLEAGRTGQSTRESEERLLLTVEAEGWDQLR